MKILTITAVLAISSATAYAVDRVARFDLNADGKVSYEELSLVCNVSKNLFRRADTDDNGFLSNREMREARYYLLSSCRGQLL